MDTTETLKILGVTLDRKLNFTGRLYKAFILPHPGYCGPLLLGVGNTQANKLEDMDYYILSNLSLWQANPLSVPFEDC